MTEDEKREKCQYILDFLRPCIKRSRRPEWTGSRFFTMWGSKTDKGMVNCLYRIIYEPGKLPEI